MSNPGNHPTLEELAAYIDGMLSKEEAARVAEHLTECEDCYFVYSETMRFQLEHPSEGTVQFPEAAEGAVIPFPLERPKAFPWWQAVAAAAVLALTGVGWYFYYFQAPPPPLATSALAASLPEKSKLTKDLWIGETLRGEGDEGVEIASEASFKFGVQVVNLQVSLEADDTERAHDILARILGLLKEEVFVEELTEFYGGLRKSLQEGAPPRALAGTAAAKAQEFREWFDAAAFDLGQWTAAGRLAAIAQEPSFFQGRTTRLFLVQFLRHETSFLQNKTTRRFLPEFLRPEETKIDPDMLPQLRSISRLLKKETLERSDYEELQRQFEAILQSEYPQTGTFREISLLRMRARSILLSSGQT